MLLLLPHTSPFAAFSSSCRFNAARKSLRSAHAHAKCRPFAVLPAVDFPGRKRRRGDPISRSVTCMANQVRQARVSKLLERELGDILVTDNVVSKALRPRGGKDCMATVTDVWISGDLQVAKIQISLYNAQGDDFTRRFNKLKTMSGYIRKLVSKRLNLKLTPELRFYHNQDFKQMYNALEALELRTGNERLLNFHNLDESGNFTEDSPASKNVKSVTLKEEEATGVEEEAEEEEEEGGFRFQEDTEDVGLAFADMFDQPSSRRRGGFGRKAKPEGMTGSKTILSKEEAPGSDG